MDAIPTYLGGFLAVLLLTSFVKIFTSLHILRAGIGVQGGGFGIVICAVAFALSLVVMGPQLKEFGGVEAFLSGGLKAGPKVEEKFRPFLEKNAHADIKQKLTELAGKLATQPKKEGDGKETSEAVAPAENFPVLIASFLVSQLQEAFQLAVIFLVPFVVIDLLVANALMALGMLQLSASVVALPLKLLLFFVVDGWALVAGKLIGGYVQ